MKKTKNIGVGHVRQSLLSIKPLVAELSRKLESTENLIDLLESKGTFSYEVLDDSVYFLKWCRSVNGGIRSYEDFDRFVAKVGAVVVRDMCFNYMGKKLTYPQLDILAKEVLE